MGFDDLGGTSGENSFLRREFDDSRGIRGCEVGMTSGARDFGDNGNFGEVDPELVVKLPSFEVAGGTVCWVASSDKAISACSSNAGPDIQLNMLSPNIC